jgi:hypothetical protein
MLKAKDKKLFDPPTDYEDDVYSWSFEQAELMRQRRFGELDLPNVIEELESLGNEQIHALESQYQRLMLHLLKWQFQPERRSSSWDISITDARSQIARRERRNHALRKQAGAIAREVYPTARKLATKETGLPLATFPIECPYDLDQLRDEDWLPG